MILRARFHLTAIDQDLTAPVLHLGNPVMHEARDRWTPSSPVADEARSRTGVEALSKMRLPLWRMPSTLIAVAGLGLAWVQFCPAMAIAQEPEIHWKEASSGSMEVPLGASFDLDFQSNVGVEFDAQYEPWEGGNFWSPKRGCKVAILGVKDFASLDMEAAHSAPMSPNRTYLCGGADAGVGAGSVLIASTSDSRFSKVLIDSCGEILKLRYVTYNRDVIQPKLVPVVGIEAPHILTPPDGVAFEHDPRDLLLAWGAVRGATTYTVEIDCRGCCGPRKELFCSEQENGKMFKTLPGLTTSAYYTIWLGPYPGRWRVCAVKVEKDPDGKPREKTGPWSPWTTFSFTK